MVSTEPGTAHALHEQVIDQTARLVHFRAGSLSAESLGSATAHLLTLLI